MVILSQDKSAATLFTKHATISPRLEISNEIICILAAQGATKLLQIKVSSTEKLKLLVAGAGDFLG